MLLKLHNLERGALYKKCCKPGISVRDLRNEVTACLALCVDNMNQIRLYFDQLPSKEVNLKWGYLAPPPPWDCPFIFDSIPQED